MAYFELEEEIESEEPLIELFLCPKNAKEAAIIESRRLDSVIQEESHE